MMERRATRLRVLPAAVVLLMLLASAYAQPASPDYRVRVRLGLLAVDGATGKGIVVNAWLTISSPGSGTVTVEPGDLVDKSTTLSTEVAYYLASIIDGVNPRLYDVDVEFETNTPVSGPSASGFIAASSLLALRGLVPDPNTTMTGMVSLTGLVLPVAGVADKVTAAKDYGYARVLLPVTEISRVPGGIGVVGVCSIEDAASQLSRGFLSAPGGAGRTVLFPSIRGEERLFSSYAQEFIEKAVKLLGDVEDPQARMVAEKLITGARRALEKSPYSAASMAFMALYVLSKDVAEHKGFNYLEKAIGISLDEAIADANRSVAEHSSRFTNRSLCGLWGYEALASASARLYLAQHAASSEKPDVRALALLRALSAKSWAELADPSLGPLVPCSLLARSAEFMVNYMQLSYDYLKSVVGRVGFNIPMPDTRSVEAWIRDARQSLRQGNYPLALGLAVYVVSMLEDTLVASSGLPAHCVERHVEFLRGISMSRDASLPAALLLSYAEEYGGYVANATNDTFVKVSLESDSAVWLIHTLVLKVLTAEGRQAVSPAPVQVDWSSYSLAGIAAEAVVLAVVGYGLAAVSRRAAAEKV